METSFGILALFVGRHGTTTSGREARRSIERCAHTLPPPTSTVVGARKEVVPTWGRSSASDDRPPCELTLERLDLDRCDCRRLREAVASPDLSGRMRQAY